MKIITTEERVIKSWCENPEEGAISQAKNLANLPFLFKHVALMPDTHFGYGMPIGGVIATEGVVIPNAVGVDIGCGMAACQTNLMDITTDQLKKIMGQIRAAIPVGFNHHKEAQVPKMELLGDLCVDADHFMNLPHVVFKEAEKATHQLGTLGGGNHFIEIQKGSDGNIWIMIHSGSRNLGFKVANHYNALAKELNKRWHSSVPVKHELAFLPLDTDEGEAYINEMNACLKFAKLNRDTMMDRVVDIFKNDLGAIVDRAINIHHNYASMEHHFGKNVMVHRKGATSAREGEMGIIPGSQGTSSYIVKGKGNPDSFQSCSHGAGRKMGRKQAQKTLNLKEEQAKLEGIIHSVRNASDLDEAPGSYKDVETVMREQKDLVGVVVKLKPLAVVKG